MSNLIDAKLDALASNLAVLLEENRQLKAKIETLQTVVTSTIDEKVLTIADLAQRYSASKSILYTKPWLLPNFGISDFTSGHKRWRLSTVMEWETDPNRKAQWQNLSVNERRRIREAS